MNKQPKPERVDADNPEWSAPEVAHALRADQLPAPLRAKLGGRPEAAATKVAVKLRLDPDLLVVLRATGDGWQTRVNRILRERFAL
ncbi:MAG: hypothetical protein BGO13_11760 [Burkholderiales bacterium 66-5]|nr:MAG: hypothetical protein BGO13_11760 [Burkholderiales bacterium 66-5]